MEQNSNSDVLEYEHISKSTDEILNYIDNRRKGITFSLKTRWKKLNNLMNGGIEPHTLITLAGISGSGKSSFANSLETDLFIMNPKIDFVVLSFSFEMLNSRQVGRKLSHKLKKTTSELYQGKDTDIVTDDDFKEIVKSADEIRQYPIYYVGSAGTVSQIKSTIVKFLKEDFVKGKWVVIFLDHVLLTKGKQNEAERQILSELQYMFIEIKKRYYISIIQVSQLNRDIESKERISNPQLHFPTRSDLFGADSMYFSSDFVMVIHRPELLQISDYGVEKWHTTGLLYLHCIKNRDGELKILSFENHLKHNRLEEYDPYKVLIKQ